MSTAIKSEFSTDWRHDAYAYRVACKSYFFSACIRYRMCHQCETAAVLNGISLPYDVHSPKLGGSRTIAEQCCACHLCALSSTFLSRLIMQAGTAELGLRCLNCTVCVLSYYVRNPRLDQGLISIDHAYRFLKGLSLCRALYHLTILAG